MNLIFVYNNDQNRYDLVLHFGVYVSFDNFYFNSPFCFSISKYFMLAKINFKMQNRNLLLKFLLNFFFFIKLLLNGILGMLKEIYF